MEPLEVQIKQEPVCLEEPADTSLDSNTNSENDGFMQFEFHAVMAPKVENEAGSENHVMMPAADIKEEVDIEEQTVDQTLEEEYKVKAESAGPSRDASSEGSDHADDLQRPRPYSCSVCSSKFAQKGQLTHHMFTHSGEKPYSCQLCSSTFTQKSSLNTHLRTHSGQRPYACSICNKMFTQKGNLNRHMSTHSNEKPYSCSLCGTKFTMKHHLKQHMVIHSGARPYSCSVCHRTFTQSSHLSTHILTHSSQGLYSCSVCNSKFTRKYNLKTHFLLHSSHFLTDVRQESC